MSIRTAPSLRQVVGREVNRRDARLMCHLCGATVPIQFYEGGGEPKLDGLLLWMFHYGNCPGVNEDQAIGVRLLWSDEPGRDTENLVLDPRTKNLSPLE